MSIIEPTVFIIGPFRADINIEMQQNALDAERIVLAFARRGIVAFAPQSHTRNLHGTVTDEFWLQHCITMLRKVGDAAFLLPGSHESEGCRGEIEEMRRLNRLVFDSFPQIVMWTDEERERREANA